MAGTSVLDTATISRIQLACGVANASLIPPGLRAFIEDAWGIYNTLMRGPNGSRPPTEWLSLAVATWNLSNAQHPDDAIEEDDLSASEPVDGESPARRRGRPPGSKNRVKQEA